MYKGSLNYFQSHASDRLKTAHVIHINSWFNIVFNLSIIGK